MLFTKSGNTREKIMCTTFSLLAARGYAGISMRIVAKEAGVALGQVTYYYKTKEKLISSVLRRLTDSCITELEITVGDSSDTEERVTAVSGYFKKLFREHSEFFRVALDITGQAMWVPAFKAEIERLIRGISDIAYQGAGSEKAPAAIFSIIYGVAAQAMMGFSGDKVEETFRLGERFLAAGI